MTHQEFEQLFCNNILCLLTTQGLSMEDLSARSGVPMDILGPMEQNILTDDFLVEHIFDLARALGCHAYELCQ